MSHRLALILSLLNLVTTVTICAASSSLESANRAKAKVSVQSLSSMPLAFTQNNGQWPDSILYRANAGRSAMWFTRNAAYYCITRRILDSANGGGHSTFPRTTSRSDAVESQMIKASLLGANADPQIVGDELTEYRSNYFFGNNSSRWHTGVPSYQALIYKSVYEGIDLKYHGDNRQMEYDFLVSPDADLTQIRMRYDGARAICVDESGELVVEVDGGTLAERRPRVFQLMDGQFRSLRCDYMLADDHSFTFKLDQSYNPALAVLIDPVISFSTYLGGSSLDESCGIALDTAGQATVTGYTYSADFPTTKTAVDTTYNRNTDVFVSRFSSNGTALAFSTFIGGSSYDEAYGVAVDALGRTYITGQTNSFDFPTTPGAFQRDYKGQGDAFVACLSSDGSALVYSTFLGDSLSECGKGIALDTMGRATVTGWTDSRNFPVTGNWFQDSCGGHCVRSDAFVTRLSADGSSLAYSTFLGGRGEDVGNAIAVDRTGRAYVTGITNSDSFPTTPGAFDRTADPGRSWDAFVTEISPGGMMLTYSTYLQGFGSDEGLGIAVDSLGQATVVGRTSSANFPTTPSAYERSLDTVAFQDAFITRLSAGGSSLVYSTFLGGSLSDEAFGVAVNDSGQAIITGFTQSTDFPTTPDAYDATYKGSSDAFIAKLSANGTNLVYSTYLGGSGEDYGNGVAVGSRGEMYVTGHTQSSDFPVTQRAYDTLYNGIQDAFVIKLSDAPKIPIVLVHGWTSDAAVWNTLIDRLHKDGFEYVWPVQLDKCGSPSEADFWRRVPGAPLLMFQGNAKILSDFVEAKIDSLPPATRAQIGDINIIGHSMGGLVARRYISHQSGDVWNPRPVRNLIMLGTPNSGSFLTGTYAELLCSRGPAAREMAPKYMKMFNHTFADNSYTTYSAVWGYGGKTQSCVPNRSCYWGLGWLLSCPNDGIVNMASVVTKTGAETSTKYDNNYGRDLCHDMYPQDLDVYESIIYPILQGRKPALESKRMIAAIDSTPQVCVQIADSMPAGIERSGQFQVEANSGISVYLFVSDSNATFTLTSPSGTTFDSASTTNDSSIVYLSAGGGIQGFDFKQAQSGGWHWTVGGQRVVTNPLSFLILGSYENVVKVEATQDSDCVRSGDPLQLSVVARDGTAPLLGLSVVGTLTLNDSAVGTPYSLLDNGLNGDSLANDGVYTVRIPSPNAGAIACDIVASGVASTGQIMRHMSLSAYVFGSCCIGKTGNVNGMGTVDLADLTALVSYLTGGGYVLPCPAAANVNATGIVDLADLTALVSYLTGGGFVLPNCP